MNNSEDKDFKNKNGMLNRNRNISQNNRNQIISLNRSALPSANAMCIFSVNKLSHSILWDLYDCSTHWLHRSMNSWRDIPKNNHCIVAQFILLGLTKRPMETLCVYNVLSPLSFCPSVPLSLLFLSVCRYHLPGGSVCQTSDWTQAFELLQNLPVTQR